jgi:tRNA modification GTPase
MIDFSDQDIDEDFEKKLFEEVKEIHNKLQQATINYKKITKLKKGINIAIIGNTNVGKSSLINYITNEVTSIVSIIDGTTRDVINSYIDFEGYPINIMDTAGIRNTRDEIEKIGVHKSKEKAEESDINILIVDNNNFENSFNTIKEFINEKSIIIVNKIDLENKKYIDEKNIDEKNIDEKNIVYLSILANKNMDNFHQTLLKKIKEIFETKENPIILHERTNNISINCLKYLEDFLNNKNDLASIYI